MMDQIVVPATTDVQLVVEAADPDGGAVDVRWEVSAGVLRAADQGSPTMRWSTPADAGDVTLTVTVTDAEGAEAVLVETLTVATAPTQIFGGQIITWTAGNSPYVIRPSSPSPPQFYVLGQLTIEAGVEIYIDVEGTEIQVEGTVTANGTQVEPVVIKPNRAAPTRGWWTGIRTNPNNSEPVVDLNHTEILNAESAVHAISTTSTFLNGCRISLCSDVAVKHEAEGPLVVTNSIITNNRLGGIRVERLTTPPDSIVIRGDSIATNGRFQDSTDYLNLEAAITLIINDPTGVIPVFITDNEISRNDFPGIRLGNPDFPISLFPVIQRNGIFGNEIRRTGLKTQLRLEPDFPTGSQAFIDATNNFWGQPFPSPADSTIIRQGIVDREDGPAVQAWVYVTPWLSTWP